MTRILTDSACDILPAQAEALGVTVVPLNVTLEDGTVLRDGIDLGGNQFYDLMKTCEKLPTTSQPSPQLYAAAVAQAKEAGDETVVVHLASGLSGTGQAARIGADLAEYEDVYFVDSTSATMGEGALVHLAVALRSEGKTAAEIAAALERAAKHLHVVAMVDDLKYLHKGGRLPGAVAVAGGMLGIKPLIHVMDGKISLAGTGRGVAGAFKAMYRKVEALGPIDTTLPTVALYTVDPANADAICEEMVSAHGIAQPLVAQVGAVIGAHVGPGATGFVFFDALPDEA